MKRFTILVWLLCLLCIGNVVAQDQTLPTLTTDAASPVLYQIKNLRADRGRHPTYASTVLSHGQLKLSIESELAASAELMAGSMWYFTAATTPDGVTLPEGAVAVNMHNLLSDKTLTNPANGTWDDSRIWFLIPNTNGGLTGFSIAYNTDLTNNSYSWNNEAGQGNNVAFWAGNDVGSIWALVKSETETGAAGFYSALASEIKARGDAAFASDAALKTAWDAATSQTSWNYANIVVLNDTYNELSAKKTLADKIASVETQYAASVGSFAEVPFTLTTENLSGNAISGEGGGIAALLDNNTSTYLHSAYSGNGTNPGTYHNLKVDLGEGGAANGFRFGYTTRNSSWADWPTRIRIWGSNDNTDFDEITVLTKEADGLVDASTATYESNFIKADKAYRYIRFDVEATKANRKFGDYNFFALSEFNFKKYNLTVSEGKNAAYVVKAREIIDAAKAVNDNADATYEELVAANATLDRLTSTFSVPFVISGASDPVYYAIQTGRGANYNWTLHYNNGGKVKLESTVDYAKDANKYWFFTLGDDGSFQIVPMAEPTAPLGYITVQDGDSKLTNVSTTANFAGTGYEYVASGNADYPIAFRPVGGNTYVSNHGGVNNYMGFYNGLNDGGTRLKLVELTAPSDVSDIVALQTAVKSVVPKEPLGSGLHQYTYNEEAYNNAVACLRDITTGDKVAAKEALRNVYVLNLPVAGKFYRFLGATNNKPMTSTYTGDRIAMGDEGVNSAETVFYLDEEGRLVAFQNGLCLGQFLSTGNKNTWGVYRHDNTKVATDIKFQEAPGLAGKYNIIPSSGRFIYNLNSSVDCGGGDGNGYRWTIEEVEYLPVPMSAAAGWGTLYSPVALERSYVGEERVKAYTGTINGEYLTLEEITGNIPANTPVVLEYKAGLQENGCVYLPVAATAEAVEGTNDLHGVITTRDVNGVATGTLCTLQLPEDDEIGFYMYTGTELNGFKSYLDVPAGSAVKGFRFGKGDNTGIQNAPVSASDGKEVFYDLNGRVVAYPTRGIYVTGSGKKVLFK